MKNNIPFKILAALGIFAAVACSMSHAQFNPATLSTGFDYSTGDYGEATDTEFLSIPVTMRWDGANWNVKLTVPYVYVSGPSSVAETGPFGLLRRPNSAAESGLGDIVLSGSYGMISPREGVGGPWVDVTGRVKFGTASRSKGLGTGENDYATQVDIYQVFGRVTPFGTIGYRVMGDPPGANLENHFYTTIGASYRLSHSTSVGGMLDLRERIVPGGDSGREVTAFVDHRFGDSWRALGYVLNGFTDASPDLGFGLSLSYAF